MLAGTTSNAHSKPSVSTATNRLRPRIFFSRVDPVRAAHFRGLYRLAVEDGRRGFGLLAGRSPHFIAQGVVNVVPGTVFLPGSEVVEDGTTERRGPIPSSRCRVARSDVGRGRRAAASPRRRGHRRPLPSRPGRWRRRPVDPYGNALAA